MFEEFDAAIAALDVPMCHEDMVEFMRVCDRLDAKVASIVHEFEASQQWALVGSVSMQQWLAAHGRMGQRTARSLRSRARIQHLFPVAADAYNRGELSPAQMEIIARRVRPADEEAFAAAEADLVPALVDLSNDDTARVMTMWKQHVDPDGHEPKHATRSRMHLSPLGDRYRADADLTPDDGDLWNTAINLAITDDLPGEAKRDYAERRADALTDILRQFVDAPHRATPPRRRPHVAVEMTLKELEARSGGRYIDGTPVDNATFDRWLCDCEVSRIVKGPSGIINYGRATRTVPAALRKLVMHRDRHCRFPGCDRPQQWCEVHHHDPWDPDGLTDLENLVQLCTKHHHLLHLPEWKSILDPDGTLTVVTPDGFEFQSRPPP